MEEKPRLMHRRLVLAVNFKLHITKDPQNIPSWGERDALAYVNTARFQSRLICGFAIGKVLWSALLYHAKGERGEGWLRDPRYRDVCFLLTRVTVIAVT